MYTLVIISYQFAIRSPHSYYFRLEEPHLFVTPRFTGIGEGAMVLSGTVAGVDAKKRRFGAIDRASKRVDATKRR